MPKILARMFLFGRNPNLKHDIWKSVHDVFLPWDEHNAYTYYVDIYQKV